MNLDITFASRAYNPPMDARLQRYQVSITTTNKLGLGCSAAAAAAAGVNFDRFYTCDSESSASLAAAAKAADTAIKRAVADAVAGESGRIEPLLTVIRIGVPADNNTMTMMTSLYAVNGRPAQLRLLDDNNNNNARPLLSEYSWGMVFEAAAKAAAAARPNNNNPLLVVIKVRAELFYT